MIRPLAKYMLRRVPLRLLQRLFPKDVICLTYHMVSDRKLPHLKHYCYKNAKQFEADVAYVIHHHRLISYEDLALKRLTGKASPPNSFLFTFDDGFAECFDVIRPILLKHGAPAAFFVTTDFIDNKSLFFESEVSLCLSAVEKLTSERVRELVTMLVSDGLFKNPSNRANPSSLQKTGALARLEPIATPEHEILIRWLLALRQTDHAQLGQLRKELGVDSAAYLNRCKPYLEADHIRRLVSDGFAVGAHSTNHRPSNPPSLDALERDIATSCDIIRQLTKQSKVPYAFPYGGSWISRRFLHSLRSRYDFIELFFDTGGLQQDAAFVVNRVWADPPVGCSCCGTNLPQLLHQAWSQRPAWCH